jgi:hemoglobin
MIDLPDDLVYDLIGEAGFQRLVAAFYRQVPGDEVLGPMYSKRDMTGAEERLRGFLIQRFGGPEHYSQKRGHPRLRMRHAPFRINQAARDRWIQLMENALAETKLPAKAESSLRAFFHDSANFLINHAG